MKIFSTLKYRLRQTFLLLGLTLLLSFTSLYFSGEQVSYAATNTNQSQEEVIQPFEYSQPASSREEAYEQAAKQADSPQKLEKAEAKEIRAAEKAENLDGPSSGLVEGAKDLLNKVTGNE